MPNLRMPTPNSKQMKKISKLFPEAWISVSEFIGTTSSQDQYLILDSYPDGVRKTYLVIDGSGDLWYYGFGFMQNIDYEELSKKRNNIKFLRKLIKPYIKLKNFK